MQVFFCGGSAMMSRLLLLLGSRLVAPASALDLAVVTGASSGIGRATARMFSSRGVPVLGVGRRAVALDETAALCSGRFDPVVADVGDADGRRAIVDAVRAFGGGGATKCAVVHNAGTPGELGGLETLSVGGWRATMAVNVEGPLFLTQSLLPLLARGSRVLHVSSGAAREGVPGFAAYCASKAALLSLTQSLAGDLDHRGIRVGAAVPGVVDTPMVDSILATTDDSFAMRPYFRDLRAATTPPAPNAPPGPPPAKGLDTPENVAAFFGWLAFDCDDDDFATREWDITDASSRHEWLEGAARAGR